MQLCTTEPGLQPPLFSTCTSTCLHIYLHTERVCSELTGVLQVAGIPVVWGYLLAVVSVSLGEAVSHAHLGHLESLVQLWVAALRRRFCHSGHACHPQLHAGLQKGGDPGGFGAFL